MQISATNGISQCFCLENKFTQQETECKCWGNRTLSTNKSKEILLFFFLRTKQFDVVWCPKGQLFQRIIYIIVIVYFLRCSRWHYVQNMHFHLDGKKEESLRDILSSVCAHWNAENEKNARMCSSNDWERLNEWKFHVWNWTMKTMGKRKPEPERETTPTNKRDQNKCFIYLFERKLFAFLPGSTQTINLEFM